MSDAEQAGSDVYDGECLTSGAVEVKSVANGETTAVYRVWANGKSHRTDVVRVEGVRLMFPEGHEAVAFDPRDEDEPGGGRVPLRVCFTTETDDDGDGGVVETRVADIRRYAAVVGGGE